MSPSRIPAPPTCVPTDILTAVDRRRRQPGPRQPPPWSRRPATSMKLATAIFTPPAIALWVAKWPFSSAMVSPRRASAFLGRGEKSVSWPQLAGTSRPRRRAIWHHSPARQSIYRQRRHHGPVADPQRGGVHAGRLHGRTRCRDQQRRVSIRQALDEPQYSGQVPEPSSLMLAGLGLIGLVVWRRRKRRCPD